MHFSGENNFHDYTCKMLRAIKENEAWTYAQIYLNIHSKMGSAVLIQEIVIIVFGSLALGYLTFCLDHIFFVIAILCWKLYSFGV